MAAIDLVTIVQECGQYSNKLRIAKLETWDCSACFVLVWTFKHLNPITCKRAQERGKRQNDCNIDP